MKAYEFLPVVDASVLVMTREDVGRTAGDAGDPGLDVVASGAALV